MPRRSLEQTEHAVFPSGTSRLTTEYVSSRSISTSAPVERRYRWRSAAGNPGCPWSRLQATSEKSIGALAFRIWSRWRRVKESLPPETPTRIRSPGLDQVEVGDGATHVAEQTLLQHGHGARLHRNRQARQRKARRRRTR